MQITVGVLALQGAFIEHLRLLHTASKHESLVENVDWLFTEVRTADQLEKCDALILPGGESTTVSLIAARSSLLEPLRDYVKCAILVVVCVVLQIINRILVGDFGDLYGALVPV